MSSTSFVNSVSRESGISFDQVFSGDSSKIRHLEGTDVDMAAQQFVSRR
jgi:hypothetical protein